MDNPELMNIPPTEYPDIKQKDWSQFIINRISKEFQEKSSKQKEVRARHKYPHRISRKGYARFASENAPRQPDLVQCGFYVLRYMRQIIGFDGSLDMASMQSLFMEKTYTTIQIDDVRSEWTTCVQEYVFE